MKNVLFVAYNFPPAGGPGVKRTLKFLKFLPKLCWEPIVLTVRYGNHDVLDDSLLKDVPTSCKIIRAYTAETILNYRSKLKNRNSKADRTLYGLQERDKRLKNICKRIYHWIGRYLGIPDAHILWLPSALVMGVKAILQRDVKVIYSTGPTFTDHVVGYLLKRITKRKLVIDFRDAWIANPTYTRSAGWAKLIEKSLERMVVYGADAVVSTTNGITKDFRKRYVCQSRDKFSTITNGYDLDDFVLNQGSSPPKINGKFNVVHTGTLKYERSPREFLLALRSLIDDKPEIEREIEVVFVGQNFRFNDGRSIEEYVREFQLERCVRIVGFVSRDKSVTYQKAADLLLLIIGVVPKEKIGVYGLSGKAFDYALSKRPVLALAQEGASAKFVRDANIGVVVDPTHVPSIKKIFGQLVEKHRSGKIEYKPRRDVLEIYDFRQLTGKLALRLEKCM